MRWYVVLPLAVAYLGTLAFAANLVYNLFSKGHP